VDLYRKAQLFPRTLNADGKVVTYADLEQEGVSRSATLWQADHARIWRVVRGAYVVGKDPPDLADRVRAVLAVCGPHCLVGFHTAAALLGFGVVEDSAIHLVVPAGSPFPSHRGIRVHQSVVPVGEPVLWNEIPCTPPARTAIDPARTLDRPSALSILDAALAADACQPEDLLAEVERQRGLKGVRRVRDLVALADERSECRQETHLRLILHDAGLRGFVPQLPVCDEYGDERYYLDLGDPSRHVAAEYDGASHLDRDTHRNDRERHNWLDGKGWRMRYFTDRDLYRRPWKIPRDVRAALQGR
jgi:very-short-patch-repair endonuclease